MERITNMAYAELIGASLDALPEEILEIIKPVHFLTGTNPFYCGLEKHDFKHYPNDKLEDGRDIIHTSHVIYPEFQMHLPKEDRIITIVLPESPKILYMDDVIHEIGHVMDYYTPWLIFQEENHPIPVTDYAQIDFEEAIAEAFTCWLIWSEENMINRIDDETLAFFRSLIPETMNTKFGRIL